MRGGAAAGQCGGDRRGREPAETAAADAAGGVSAGCGSRPARRRLRDPGGLRFPGGRAETRLHGGDGQERGVAAAGGIRDGDGPRAERGQRPHRARLHRHPLRDPQVEPRTPGRDQGGSGPARGAQTAGQSAVRRDESRAESALRLRAGLLRPRRGREPDQGVAGRSADRPHELPQVPGEPVARVADGRRLRAPAGVAAAGGANPLRPLPGDLAAQPVAQARRACRRLRAPHRPASADQRQLFWPVVERAVGTVLDGAGDV